jgi:hypothetical protein
MEMGDKLYLMSFETEGVEHIKKSSGDGDEGGEDGDEDKGDAGLDDDDLLGEDPNGENEGTQTPRGCGI